MSTRFTGKRLRKDFQRSRKLDGEASSESTASSISPLPNRRFFQVKKKAQDLNSVRTNLNDIKKNKIVASRSPSPVSKIKSKAKDFTEFSAEVDKIFKNQCKSKKDGKNIGVQQFYSIKRCEICEDWKEEEKMAICDYCEDAFHIYCLDPPRKQIPKETEVFICPRCKEDYNCKRKKLNNSTNVTHVIKIPKISEETKERKCTKCSKSTKIQSEFKKFILCEKCKKDYHIFCYNPDYQKNKSVFCTSCEKEITTKFGKKESQSILNFFTQIKKLSSSPNKKTEEFPQLSPKKKRKIPLLPSTHHSIPHPSLNNPIIAKRVRKACCVLRKKKKPEFRMPKFEKDNPLFLETRNSICKALYGKNLTFDDDLHYPCAECPSTMNTVELEPNIQKLSERNLKTFLKFKEWTRQGYYAPVTVINHPQQGACVQATIDIPNLTLLCEYVGDVLPVRHVLFEQSNDSIMDLIKAHTSSKSLAICPNKRANLARFISGINNSTKEGKKKQNVKSARFNIQGRVGIILYADRLIKKGEILYYDYNEGGFESYPTEDFI